MSENTIEVVRTIDTLSGYKLLLELDIDGQPARKSNSRRLVTNRKTNKPMFIKSEAALEYEGHFFKQVPGSAKRGLGSLDEPLAMFVVVYYQSRRPDLSVELIMDLLEKTEVVANDRYIYETRAWKFFDKDHPRIRLRLYALPPKRLIPF